MFWDPPVSEKGNEVPVMNFPGKDKALPETGVRDAQAEADRIPAGLITIFNTFLTSWEFYKRIFIK